MAEQCEEHKESAAKQTEMAVAATAASAAAVTQVNRANQQLLAEREAAKKQVSGLNATIRQLESEIASLQVVTADLTSELTKNSKELVSARGSLSELQDTPRPATPPSRRPVCRAAGWPLAQTRDGEIAY